MFQIFRLIKQANENCRLAIEYLAKTSQHTKMLNTKFVFLTKKPIKILHLVI